MQQTLPQKCDNSHSSTVFFKLNFDIEYGKLGKHGPLRHRQTRDRGEFDGSTTGINAVELWAC